MNWLTLHLVDPAGRVEAPNAGADDPCAHQGRAAARHVHHAAPGEVDGPDLEARDGAAAVGLGTDGVGEGRAREGFALGIWRDVPCKG